MSAGRRQRMVFWCAGSSRTNPSWISDASSLPQAYACSLHAPSRVYVGILVPKNNAPHGEPRAKVHHVVCITHLWSESKRYCTAKRQFSRQSAAMPLKLVNDVSAAEPGLGGTRKR